MMHIEARLDQLESQLAEINEALNSLYTLQQECIDNGNGEQAIRYEKAIKQLEQQDLLLFQWKRYIKQELMMP